MSGRGRHGYQIGFERVGGQRFRCPYILKNERPNLKKFSPLRGAGCYTQTSFGQGYESALEGYGITPIPEMNTRGAMG